MMIKMETEEQRARLNNIENKVDNISETINYLISIFESEDKEIKEVKSNGSSTTRPKKQEE